MSIGIRSSLSRLIVATLISASIILGVAAQRRGSDKQKTSEPPPPAFDPKPFDVTREQLPGRYIGNSLIEIFHVLNDRNNRKERGEFERTSDYTARLAAQARAPVVGSVFSDSTVAFAFSPDKGLTTKYDADLSVWDFHLRWYSHLDAGESRVSSARLLYFHKSKVTGEYIGKNAFNMSAKVTVFEEEDISIVAAISDLQAIEGSQPLDDAKYPPWIDFMTSVPMPPMEAIRAKTSVRALVIGTLLPETAKVTTTHETPKIDFPYDTHSSDESIGIRPMAIWFYDSLTGRIFMKLTAK